ncbi:MAG TPA: hypothetical protein EYP53_07695 [Candidatus Latescibacteria bacterium]|nr:hypothetical protein [Candidatus Latescibacterota bacterium]
MVTRYTDILGSADIPVLDLAGNQSQLGELLTQRIAPEFEGYITIEISNTTPLPAKIYANEGIAQVLFFEGGGNDGQICGQEALRCQ